MLPAELVQQPVEIHYHHDWLVWVIFAFGDGIHMLLQIDTIARNTKTSWRAVFTDAWARLLYRAAVCIFVFGLIWHYPHMLTAIASKVGITVSSDEAEVFALPMNNILAFGWGLGLDVMFGYIPWFKSQLPSV